MTTLIKKDQLAVLNKIDFAKQSHSALVTYCEDMRFTNNILYERQYLNTENSSLSSSNLLPWQQLKAVNEPLFIPDTVESAIDVPVTTSGPKNKADTRKKRKKGAGRTQVLATNNIIHLHASCCSLCDKPFADTDHRCYRAFYQVELVRRDGDGSEYIVIQTKYRLYDSHCQDCEAVTRTRLPRIETGIDGMTLPGQGLIGPRFASELIDFHKHDGMTLRKLKRKIYHLYGINISTGLIIQAINYGGLCCESQVEQYRLEAEKAELAHMDETTWKDGGENLYLWVIVTATICLFFMGRRTKIMALSFLNNFDGWLMSDGYTVYRDYKKRFRCHAHLLRKATGCRDSDLETAKAFGTQLLALLKICHSGIYAARELDTKVSIKADFTDTLDRIKVLCEANQEAEHPKTKALARELLNDWDAIFRIVDYPWYPLTNNEAERALRHWVILRKVIQGTQSLMGRRATCAIASMIGTAKRQAQHSIHNIHHCIAGTMRVMNNLSYQPLRLSG